MSEEWLPAYFTMVTVGNPDQGLLKNLTCSYFRQSYPKTVVERSGTIRIWP